MERFLQSLRNLKPWFFISRPGRTVKFMFPAVILGGAFLAASVINSEETSYIRLEPSTTVIEAGKQFYIDVYAHAHVPVNAVDITLHFDKEAVKVIGVDTGQSVLTIWTEEPIVADDHVTLRGGTFRNGFLKEHLIASINLEGTRTGASTFKASDVMFLAADGEGTPVSVSDQVNSKISLYIYDENTDPAEISVDVEVSIVTDINGDGEVSLQDVSSFLSAWNDKSKTYDFNGDGKMTFKDFSIILYDWFAK